LVALTSIDDSAHDRAMELSRTLVPDRIVTTDEEVLTNDRHFEQEGFRALFRDI
jgi:hypothetical protein